MDYSDWIAEHCKVGDVKDKAIEIHCMFHDDEHASLSIDKRTGRWKCFGCGKTGNITTIAKELNVSVPDKLKQFTSVTSALPNTFTRAVKRAHERLMKMESDVRERLITEWDISPALMKKLKLGWDEDRLWIPIYYQEQLVNIRKYKFDADQSKIKAKVISVKGVKTVYIFPIAVVLKNTDIIIVEGEKDAIVGLAHGLPCVSFTGGASTIPAKKMLQHFLHKSVAVCYDCDSAGEKGSEKVINSLKKIADCITKIELPKSELGKGGDLTDFFSTGHTQEEFAELRKTAKPRWPVPKIEPEADDTVYNVGLYNSRRPEWFQKRMSIRAKCIGKTLQPFTIPHKGVIDCVERGTKEACSLCSISNKDIDEPVDIQIENLETEETLSLIKCTAPEQKRNLSKVFGLACDTWEWVSSDHLNVEQLILTQDPLQEEENFEEPPIYHEGYFVGNLIMDENLTYNFTGRHVASPKTQQVTHVFSNAVTPQGFLQGTPTDDDWQELDMFQVSMNGASA